MAALMIIITVVPTWREFNYSNTRKTDRAIGNRDIEAPHHKLKTPSQRLRQLTLGDVMRTIYSSTDTEQLRSERAMKRPHACPSRAVIPYAGGRTGNMLYQYMATWALAKKNMATFLAAQNMIEAFEGFFPHMTAERGDLDLLLMDCLEQWKTRKVIYYGDIADSWLDFPEKGWVYVEGFPINISTTAYENMLAHVDDLRQELRFSAEVTRVIQSYLHQVRRSVTPKDDVGDDVTFVGVHARKTDYRDAMFNMDGVWMEANNADYFQRGMQYFRRHYGNVVFLVVSDDMPWCREHLASLSDVIFFPGDDKHPHMLDLALLANCNHTLMTYGTFALSGALLSGGELVISKDPQWRFHVWEKQKAYWPGPWLELPAAAV